MPSNPLPSSARSALREAATTLIAARKAEHSLHPSSSLEERESTMNALDDAFRAYRKLASVPETILALLSLAERGAEDAKRVEWTEGDLREPLESALNQAWSDFVGDTGCYPECIHVERSRRGVSVSANFGVSSFASSAAGWLAMKLNERAIASSPTGGTTE